MANTVVIVPERVKTAMEKESYRYDQNMATWSSSRAVQPLARSLRRPCGGRYN